jgi:hypothetical protein
MEEQQIITALGESFKCCVCFDIPLPNSCIYSCHPNGHVVCSDCFQKITTTDEEEEGEHDKKCPMCRVGLFSDEKHVLLQKVFETCSPMFSRPCQYSQFGCQHVAVGEKYFEHDKECPLSPAQCPKCFYQAPFEKFYNKQLTNHEINCYSIVETTQDENKHVWTVKLYFNENKLLTSKGYFSAKSKKHLFLRCQENQNIRLALELKPETCKFHVLPVWMDREKKEPPPLITIALRFNGNTKSEICVFTLPNFQQVLQNDGHEFYGITLTRKQLIDFFFREKNACFICNPILDSDYIELQVMCNKNNNVC